MAKTSTQKFIARNRAPRVTLEYSVEMYGATPSHELPFVIGVLADLTGTPLQVPPGLAERRMTDIDIDNFDDRMRSLEPRTAFRVPDAIHGQGELIVELTFASMEDFLPAAIARNVPGLDQILTARTQLANLVVYMDGKTDAGLLVQRVLHDDALRQQALSATEDSLPTPSELAPESFTGQLAAAFKPKTREALAHLQAALRTLAAQDAQHADAAAEPTIAAMIAKLDGQLERQINLILHHAEFQKLESSWRGLHYLVSNTETNESLKIRFMSVSKADLGKTLKRYAGAAWNQSPLFKEIYEEVFGTFGGEPYGCLIGDYEFNHAPQDVAILSAIARVAAAAHAPFLAACSPGLLNLESWQELSNPRDLSAAFSTPQHVAWRSLREQEDARFLALTMPRFLARAPYGSRSDPVEEFAFEETVRRGDTSCFVWANSAYAMAMSIARSYKMYGWCSRIRGIESGGAVDNLPCHVFPDEDGGFGSSSTEISISDRWEAELARMGLMPLIQRKNAQFAAFIGAQSLHKPPEYDDLEMTVTAALSARLPYILASCRFVHYLMCIVRDAPASFASREDIERTLNGWLEQYVDHDPGNSSEEAKARKPLADGQVVIEPIEGNAYQHKCKFYVRPHYQLEGLTTASLRMTFTIVSRQPA